jgi:hypothetical protein
MRPGGTFIPPKSCVNQGVPLFFVFNDLRVSLGSMVCHPVTQISAIEGVSSAATCLDNRDRTPYLLDVYRAWGSMSRLTVFDGTRS